MVQRPLKHKTEAELRYIIRDAGEAARAMRGHDPKAEAKYLDQINDACDRAIPPKGQVKKPPVFKPTYVIFWNGNFYTATEGQEEAQRMAQHLRDMGASNVTIKRVNAPIGSDVVAALRDVKTRS